MFKLEARPEPSKLMSVLSPLLALALTVAIGVALFVLLGKDPLRGLQAFFVEPLKSWYALSELAIKATPLPGPDASREAIVEKAINMIANTAPFDITHHPAMAVPCGVSDGLPVSVMLIGRHFDEPTIYRAAHAFEQSGDWTRM